METRCTKDRAPIHGGGPALEGQSPELQYLLRAVNKLSTFIQAALTNLWHESIKGWPFKIKVNLDEAHRLVSFSELQKNLQEQ